MNAEQFMILLNDLPDEMVLSAVHRKKTLITRHWAKISAAAACFLLIAGGTFVLTRRGSTPRESIMNEQSLAAEVTEIAAVTETTAESMAASQTTVETTATITTPEEGQSEPAAVIALTVPAMPETAEASPAKTQPASVQTTVTAAEITTTAETTTTTQTQITPEDLARIISHRSEADLKNKEKIYRWLQELGTPEVEIDKMRENYYLTDLQNKPMKELRFGEPQSMTVFDVNRGENRTKDGISQIWIRKLDGDYYIIFFNQNNTFDEDFSVVKLLSKPNTPLFNE
jgi:hypothetical protein